MCKKTFEIFYHDLIEEAQNELQGFLKTTPEEENWDICPIAVIQEREEDDKEK